MEKTQRLGHQFGIGAFAAGAGAIDCNYDWMRGFDLQKVVKLGSRHSANNCWGTSGRPEFPSKIVIPRP